MHPKIPGFEFTTGTQKRDRSESAATNIPAAKSQKTVANSRPQAQAAMSEHVSPWF